MTDYLNTVRENEFAFRAILERAGFENKGMSLEKIYAKYSTGDRSGKLTIRDFEKKGADHFEFAWENSAILGGHGRSELWSYANGELKFIEVVQVWMS
jgi:hypothetical protein